MRPVGLTTRASLSARLRGKSVSLHQHHDGADSTGELEAADKDSGPTKSEIHGCNGADFPKEDEMCDDDL